MKKYSIKTQIIILLLLVVGVFSSCSLDDRIDDLTGGYDGAFIDKLTGDTIASEYFGAKIKLLDLAYGSVAQPLNYNVLPDGTFHNTKVFPSKYKIWADGPFLSLDTVVGNINGKIQLKINAVPNVSINIVSVVVDVNKLTLKYEYVVNDNNSARQEVGVVYSKYQYPGFRNAVAKGGSGTTFKLIKAVLPKTKVETVYLTLDKNSTYYVRVLARSGNAGDYWNYSKQITITTTE